MKKKGNGFTTFYCLILMFMAVSFSLTTLTHFMVQRKKVIHSMKTVQAELNNKHLLKSHGKTQWHIPWETPSKKGGHKKVVINFGN